MNVGDLISVPYLMSFILTILLIHQPFFVWLCTCNFISRFSAQGRRSEIPMLWFVKHIGWHKIAHNLIKLILFSDKISKVSTYVAYLQKRACKIFFFRFLTRWIFTLSAKNYRIIMYAWLYNLSQYLWVLKFVFKVWWKNLNLFSKHLKHWSKIFLKELKWSHEIIAI